MARGIKTNNEKISEIISSYALTNSYNATAKEVGVSNNTVKRVILKQRKNNPDELARVVNEKKELFQDKANRIIDNALELIEDRINTARYNQNELEEIIQVVLNQDKKELNENQKKNIVNKISKMQLNSLSELTTALGTLYDKMRLAKGESTNNQTIKVTMDSEVEELSK